MQYKRLVMALMTLSVPSLALADELELAEVEIGSGLDTQIQRVYAPTLKQQGVTLGDALGVQVGIHSSQFGAGASAPVVRGQTAYRNLVVQNGVDVVDMSQTSPDHAIVVDTPHASHIDVVQGVDKLRYGTGIAGAVIAVNDKSLPNALSDKAAQGDVGVRFSSVNREKLATATTSFGLGSQMALHLQGLMRQADDYRVLRYEHEHDGKIEHLKSVPNTKAKSTSGTVGLSWVDSRGFVGLSYGDRKDKYGLPGHSEEYHSCHTHLGKSDGMELHCGHHGHEHGHSHGKHNHGHNHDHDHEVEHEHHDPMVDLRSQRYDMQAKINQPAAGIDNIYFAINQTKYRHDEVEGDEPISFFRNKGNQARLELSHQPLYGLTGVIGVSYGKNTMSILGKEALLDATTTKRLGVFATERFNWQNLAVQFGGRAEQHKIDTSNQRVIDFGRGNYKKTAYAYGVNADWHISPVLTASFGFMHQQRVPTALELYARGLHLASNTYEWGDDQYDRAIGGLNDQRYTKIVQQNNESKADFQKRLGVDRRLDKEKSNNLELGLAYQDDKWNYQLKGFYKDYDGYIYARTLDKMENFRLVRYAQADAHFYGVEGTASYQFMPQYTAEIFGDYVRGKVAGDNAPRVPATRLGSRILADFGFGLTGSLEYVRTFKQNHVANFEQKTAGNHLVNVGVDYQGQNTNYQVFFKANNLLNQAIYSHASFLANVPQAGRNFSLGVNYQF